MGSEKGSHKVFLEGGFQKLPRTPPRRVRPLGLAPYFGMPCCNVGSSGQASAWQRHLHHHGGSACKGNGGKLPLQLAENMAAGSKEQALQ